MATYVLKRVLLMVPTLFGISLVVWLIMVAAPGRPGGESQDFGEIKTTADPSKELAKGESQYLFRRQFALDRPVFWNSWAGLSDTEVLAAVEAARAPIETAGAKAKTESKERLEDWGTYAVPALVRLLARTEGDLQDRVLTWLRLSATRRTVISRDPEVVARNQAWAKENAELQKLGWGPTDPPERRAAVVKAWQDWYRANEDRWTWSFFQRLTIALTDTQFGTYWGRLLRFDLGTSHMYRRPVAGLILERLPVSLTLSLLSIFIIYVLAIPLGIFSAVRPYTPTDRAITVFLFVLYSLPSFFIGTVLLRSMTIGRPFDWFPTSGFAASEAQAWNTWARFKDTIWHITLPLVTLTYGGLAGVSRFARTGMLDVIRSDYVRTARAKGLGEADVILRHAARNGMMPIVTLLAGLLPALVGGSIVVEFIFNMKGMGLLGLEAIQNRDYNIIVGETIIVAILTLVGILLADILYAVLDPRISYS